MIAAGGTGGHVYPALAVAEVLRSRDVPVIWLGTRTGLEARVVPAAGIDIEWVNVSGLRGKNFRDTLVAPLKLVQSLAQAWKIFRRWRPRAVLGMGGFVAGPGGLMALLFRLPLVIHEQNSVAGLTNRLLSRFARRVFTAFPNVFNATIGEEQIGNPVRDDLENLSSPVDRMQHEDNFRLLVVGGSRGARRLNEIVPAALANTDLPLQVRHQTGSAEQSMTQQRYAEYAGAVEVVPYIEDMAEAYGWADIMICRAGAMTVSELTAAGLASILIPYPHAVDDHQRSNALWLVQAGAATMIAEDELDADVLVDKLEALCRDRQTLVGMAARARELHRPGAAERVADALLEEAA
ncbi:MAG: undecaprenyldiphospho-muramoylpentapeptide beta-N-acetylglucosaminyltransferase [Gammaproteobacteria bacterium]|nr:undecaprenyldiphospho-muramoylpentapeptide beta-N-acetylglucosaminyltransferase [Gammaproteobacteria bacterium]